MQPEPFDPSRRILGDLNYLGFDSPGWDFSFEEVVEGIRALDGDERSGLHIQLGSWDEASCPGVDVTDPSQRLSLRMTMKRETFCVGGTHVDASEAVGIQPLDTGLGGPESSVRECLAKPIERKNA